MRRITRRTHKVVDLLHVDWRWHAWGEALRSGLIGGEVKRRGRLTCIANSLTMIGSLNKFQKFTTCRTKSSKVVV
jgi:hypothetical protein